MSSEPKVDALAEIDEREAKRECAAVQVRANAARQKSAKGGVCGRRRLEKEKAEGDVIIVPSYYCVVVSFFCAQEKSKL